jgi:hypothetical protein
LPRSITASFFIASPFERCYGWRKACRLSYRRDPFGAQQERMVEARKESAAVLQVLTINGEDVLLSLDRPSP